MNEKHEKPQMRELGGSTHDLSRRSDSLTEVGSSQGIDPNNTKEASKLLANPLMNKSQEELFADVDEFVDRVGLSEHRELFYKAALVAQDRDNYERLDYLSEDDKEILRNEKRYKWRQTKTFYWQIFMCSMGAVVQGMPRKIVNGANLFYPDQFGIGGDSTKDTLLVGLVNSAPYICSALFSCWLTYPLNRWLGRRGAIFWSTLCAGLGCIWGALTNTWWHLFISRLFLGLGIGPKSSTVPVLAAEISPAAIRGAMAMQWQTWTAFGICLGTVSSLIFKNVPDKPHITGLNWRLMLGSACLPAILVCAQVYFTPESPRWLIGQNRHLKAWESLNKLRTTELSAAIDLYLTSKCIEMEEIVAEQSSRNRLVELFTIKRNLRAVRSSSIVMFAQQFCGINAIAYYSSVIFENAGTSVTTALLGSFGYGLINWVFSLPAFFTIDTFGRRSLLLFTLPFLSLFMFIAGSGFWISDQKGQLGMVVTGVYLFAAFYGPGLGPVPFTYSAECYPLQVRELGMGLATAVTWFWNAVNALFFPLQIRSWTSAGAFYWFGGWNAILFVLVLLFCPETKAYTLEELDDVFNMSTSRLMKYGLASPAYWFRRYVLRQNVHRTPLQDYNSSEDKDCPEIQHREKV
ncbi:hypothetical protein BMF94_0178 [Rhodotorula taiwanensis]|uniref:Major facilitator superfamily (MFS) profile domain-containing protein n=1 Tax=Rhodotorula taiwanensis TaxID=741276 RepID=A0A2S5BII4_9BASI|nr:hypothetical protein BMF94_0178 [Rhodotorula taiwanensis]